jgi:hypothetical protein
MSRLRHWKTMVAFLCAVSQELGRYACKPGSWL